MHALLKWSVGIIDDDVYDTSPQSFNSGLGFFFFVMLFKLLFGMEFLPLHDPYRFKPNTSGRRVSFVNSITVIRKKKQDSSSYRHVFQFVDVVQKIRFLQTQDGNSVLCQMIWSILSWSIPSFFWRICFCKPDMMMNISDDLFLLSCPSNSFTNKDFCSSLFQICPVKISILIMKLRVHQSRPQNRSSRVQDFSVVIHIIHDEYSFMPDYHMLEGDLLHKSKMILLSSFIVCIVLLTISSSTFENHFTSYSWSSPLRCSVLNRSQRMVTVSVRLKACISIRALRIMLNLLHTLSCICFTRWIFFRGTILTRTQGVLKVSTWWEKNQSWGSHRYFEKWKKKQSAYSDTLRRWRFPKIFWLLNDCMCWRVNFGIINKSKRNTEEFLSYSSHIDEYTNDTAR